MDLRDTNKKLLNTKIATAEVNLEYNKTTRGWCFLASKMAQRKDIAPACQPQ